MCPYYMSIGMTYDQYWNGEPEMAKYFRRAEEERMKTENFRQWRMGMYMTHAVSTALGNAFRKEGSASVKYAKEPFPLFADDEKKTVSSQQEKIMRMIAKMEAKTQIHKQLFSEEGGTDNGRGNDK